MFGANNFPRRAILHPIIWKLDLIAIAKLLFEKSVLVVNAVTNRRQIKRGHGIQKTGCQASESSITQAHVVFLIAEHGEIQSEFLDGLMHVVKDPRAIKIIHIEAPHQKFEGEIIEAFGVDGIVLSLSGDHPLD